MICVAPLRVEGRYEEGERETNMREIVKCGVLPPCVALVLHSSGVLMIERQIQTIEERI